jgi:ATP-dependent exoDNAse (exonuclease V) alpha subunit
MQRLSSKLSPDEQNAFSSAVHLFSTNAEVITHNRNHLTKTGNPVAKINAEHGNEVAERGSIDQASGLSPVLELLIGSRVMLRKNIWIKGGLVNGSIGTVMDIIYESNRSPPSLPSAVMVKFDKFKGQPYVDGTFPVIAIKTNWNQNNMECWRLQIPNNLAFGITIHKAQGLT